MLLVAVPAQARSQHAVCPAPAAGYAHCHARAQALWPHVAWVEPQVRIWNRDLHDNLAALADDERVAALVQ
ncbi:MAG: hypothetical protein H0W96_14450, partial [Solirubrobacterales bacterium]|nr:hypothetical protein [Solirubrobacterales bacterium]